MKKYWKRILLLILGFLILHAIGEGLYAIYVARESANWETSVERDSNGVILGCDVYDLLPSEPGGKGTALLLVHGINASPRDYDLLAPALAEEGYACRAIRLPGFAEPLEKYQQTVAQDWIDTVARELAALRSQYERVGLVAHSLGGAVAIGALLEEPSAADFAVLLAPAIEVSDSRSFLLSTRGWRAVSKRTLWFVNCLPSPYAMDCRDTSRHNQPGRTPFTPLTVVDELFQLMTRNRSRASEITIPLTMVVSQGDLIVSTSEAKAYFGELASLEKKLIVLENSGHEITFDYEWQRVVEAVKNLDAASFDAASFDAETNGIESPARP